MASANGDLLDFSSKVVLVTGAATGIGRAVAIGFASRGAKAAIGDINEEAARETLRPARLCGQQRRHQRETTTTSAIPRPGEYTG